MARTRAQAGALRRSSDQASSSHCLSEQPAIKRKQSVEATTPEPDQKRQRTHASVPSEPVTSDSVPECVDPIAFWAAEGRWPEAQCWPEKESSKAISTMERLLARKILPSRLTRTRSSSATSVTPSDQRPREEKSAPYRNAQYPLLLETKGSYMKESPLGITDQSERLCEMLINNDQPTPEHSLFDDDIFQRVCSNLQDKNEARVIQDISRLIVPSAEQHALRKEQFHYLVESVNEGWNNSIPLTGTRPQPDYSVGFRREAFTEDQRTKLSPFIGEFLFGDQSLFMATFYMYFPFLTCEITCGAADLQVANRQNAHSMTLAVRAVTELFRVVKRGHEINRQILAFSISHDQHYVRIYGHYPVIDGDDIKYYCHSIHDFSISTLGGRDKWLAYRVTKNIYDVWMPAHLEKIRSAIDQLPSELDFDVPALSESAGLSQDQGNMVQSGVASASAPNEQNDQPTNAVLDEATPDTSFTRPGVTKRKKL